ncbi:hypothetical protein DICPUDRAFT_94806 [Dictyostelium purpureum]|uniref:Uncharacterized protein n=1 Tax=Dictyostelium purpureum TaxID=5786 RepID=F0ZNQ4_DICPU|nr:uncharacterized protein DICPUDRAFT_94806 [Dictyostelium purpureum]EGC34426.1 hypothetical protein DICPUDRAFT_94806 [Dictyostelium purpureum]|eukprot:XP_003289055.1 hypothetical protein DICPUDRAFT_94806 [Dictyostelium purpureum]
MEIKDRNKSYERNNGDVAVIGVGFRVPSGDLTKSISNTNELWNGLSSGFNGIVETSERWSDNYAATGDIICKYAGLIPLDEWKSFDPIFFGIHPNDENVSSIDPQQRMLLKCTWEALEDSGIDPITLRGSNTSTFMGSSTIDYNTINKSPFETQSNIFGSTSHSVANRISYCFDFRGESLTIDTACSSSLNAINLGYKSIKEGISDLSIVGGVNFIIDPHFSKSFTQLGLLSPTGRCHSFSSDADGYVRSESVGVVVLKSLEQAIKDGNNIYCVIKGSSSNVDGNYDKSNFYSPSKSSQYENIKSAIESTNGQINASDVDYVECHGTGTPTGDPIELEGISRIFKDTDKQVLIGSIKSNIGHGEASSGVIALIKCCVMFKNQSFVQNINFKSPNPDIKFEEWRLKVVTEPTPFDNNKNTVMAINNFGITGSNCCIILSGYTIKKGQNSKIIKKYLIPFSSNSSISLDNYKKIIINQSDTFDFNQFANNQIKYKSTSLVQRSVIIAKNWSEFIDKKNEISSNSNTFSNFTVKNKSPFTVFVFCGQGSQYNRMALELYENEKIFRQWVDKFDNELFKYYGYSVLEKLRSIDDNDMISIHEPILAQPANVMIQVSLFELYKHWGIKSDLIVGHSLGEISASYCSGMIDFETLCYLVYHRSVAQNKTTGTGRMLSVNISAEEYISNYSSKYPSIELACFNSPSSIVIAEYISNYSSKYPTLNIACYNSPSSIVLSGKEHLLDEIVTDLKSKDIFCAMLGTLSSLHTSSQLVIKDEICSMNIKSNQSTTPVFSTVTTNLFNHETTPFNSEYVFENVLQPVRFTQTISNIYKYIEENNYGNEVTFIEIAPHPTLSFYLNQMKSKQSTYFNNGDKITIHSPLHKKKNDYDEFLKTISTLYVNHSFNINFKSQIDNNDSSINNSISVNCLPPYQWDDKMYFKNNSTYEKIKKEGPPIQNLGNTNESPFKSYQTFINTKKQPFQWLKGHQVKGKYYFPGCGYVINLFNIYPNQDITINNIEFKTPLVLQDGVNQCLQTTIITLSKNEYNVKSHFKDTTTNQWVLCSTGNFSLFKNDNEINKINIDNLKTKCNFTKLSKSDLYESIKIKTGLSYKGLFQGVKECYIGDNCSFSIVSLNEIQNQNEFNHLIENDSMKSFFNAAILDSCFHGMLGFAKHQCQIVLDRIEGLKYYSKYIPQMNQQSELYVYSEMKSRIDSYSYSGSIKIMLSDGTLLVEVSLIVCTSLTPIIDNTLIIPPPSNEIYTPYQQSKDSVINKPESFKHLYQIDELSAKEQDYKVISNEFIFTLFYTHINQRCPDINNETLSTIDYNQFKQLYYRESINENFFIFIFENLKKYNELENKKQMSPHNKNEELFERAAKIMAKQIFPLENDDPYIDTAESLFDGGYLEDFYQTSKVVQPLNNLLCEIIIETIKPIVNEPIVFRILEFGGGVGSLSILVLEKINKLLIDNPSSNIDIEFTWSDISASFFTDIKEKFSNIKGINIIYRVLDLEKEFIDQELKPSYYDMIIMSNVLHVVKQLKFSLNEIHNILTPNGQLIYIESPYKSIIFDSIFGIFSQWWPSPEDIEIRKDRCCMKQSSWYKLLDECNYKDTIMSENDELMFLIQTRKPSINETVLSNTESMEQLKSFNNIILFGKSDNYKINQLFKSNNQLNSTKINQMNSFKEFKYWLKQSIDSIKQCKTLIMFMKTIDTLDVTNFKEITFEYIQINQSILQHELSDYFTHVLILLNSTSDNYLSSSIVGAARYFVEFPQLNLFSLDFDNISLQNDNILSLIDILINPTSNIQREFTITNNTVYYERYKKQSKFKQTFKSESFETNKDNLMVQLDPNLEYVLKTKKQQLKPNEIEIEVKGTGINYKDYLIYIGQISNNIDIKYGKEEEAENGANQIPNIGNDFSGIITRCGSDVKKLKVGNEVFGIASKTSGSHVVMDYRYVNYKPNNMNHVQAASIPSIYATSLHSIFYTGNLQSDQTILIHSAAGGIGLSSLELLKYKQHKGYIFLTVGSKDKEQYLIDKYGSFITGIYSSRNKNYVEQIKNKLLELECDKDHQGVDLILNTLSSEYMDSNFQCLNTCGRIVDLSITHLTPNDYMTNNHFKYNYGYHNVELVEFSGSLFKYYLKKIVKMFNSNKLELIPIIEYSNSQFKNALEYINQRQHIGKIVVNHDSDMLSKVLNEQQQNNSVIMKNSYDISRLDIGKNILVTGQTGIILEIMKWLVKYSNKSIDNIIILSRSPLKWELELLINQTKHQKDNTIKFHFNQIDIEDSKEIQILLNQLESNSNITNIDTIIHFAFVNDIGGVQDVDINRVNIAHGAKTIGAINLHNESIQRSWKLKQFIMASSVVSMIGSDQQCCYVSACSVVDSLSKFRKSIGLPSLSVNLGAISSTGFVSRNDAIETMFHSSFFKLFSPQLILSSLDLFIQNSSKYSNYCLSDFDFEKLQSDKSNYHLSKLDYQTNMIRKTNKSINSLSGDSDESMKQSIINKISELLSIEESKINLDLQLTQYGTDSLMQVQLKNWIDNQFGHNLITIQQLQKNKISQSIDIITKTFKNNNTKKESIVDKENKKSIEEFIQDEIKLEDSIVSKPFSIESILNNNNKSILLTGSNGYLGGYLLNHLVQMQSCSKVYCLIRNKSNSPNPVNETIDNLKHHQLYDSLTQQQQSKIIAITGDISKYRLGLPNETYSILSNEVDIIINSAADLNLQSNYQESKPVNVNGVKELIKFSVSNETQKPIVHFSSFSVFFNHSLNGEEFDEDKILPRFESTSIGYIQSKVITENLLTYAEKSRGIPSLTIRLPDIWSNPETGKGHPNDLLHLSIQASSVIGYYPNIYKDLFTAPITVLSRNIINIIFSEKSWVNSNSNSNLIFSLNGDSIGIKTIYNVLEKYYNCEEIEFEKWQEIVSQSNHKSCTKYNTHKIQNKKTFVSDIFVEKGFKMSNKTKQLLKSIGSYDEKEWEINNDMIINNINYNK